MRSKRWNWIGFVAGVALAVAVTGVAAASGGGGSSSGGHGAKKSAPTVKMPSIPSVQMPMLVAPVVVDGELVRYVYLNVALILPDDSNKLMLLDKIPYIQDAFLREVHGAPIVLNKDPGVLDEAGVGGRLLSICDRLVGSGIVKKVAFRDSTKDFQ